MDLHNKKYDIVVIAGQSNAEGNGLFDEDLIYNLDNVYELVDKNNCYLQVEPTVKLIYTLPFEFTIKNYEEMLDSASLRRASLVSSFAYEYINNGCLKEGRDLLIIKDAIGGTGFSRNEWGITSVLYKRLKEMTAYALSLNKENRIVAFLWHQGEHDAFENEGFSLEERYDFYKESFFKQFKDYIDTFNLKDLILIGGEFVPYWVNTGYTDKSNAIYKATKDAIYSLTGNDALVSSEGLLSNYETNNKIEDYAHFSRKSVYELGRRYFNKFIEIKNKRKD